MRLKSSNFLGKDLKILAFANSGDDGEITRTVAHHVSKRCAGSQISLTDLVKLEVFDQVRLGDDDGGFGHGLPTV